MNYVHFTTRENGVPKPLMTCTVDHVPRVGEEVPEPGFHSAQ